MAPRMGEPMDELANSPILEVAKQETGIKEEVHDVIKTEIGIDEGDIYDVKMTEPIDLKPKTEEIDQSRNSPCAETLKEKLSLKENEISKSETSSKEENKKIEERKENEKKFKRDGERNDKERKEEVGIKVNKAPVSESDYKKEGERRTEKGEQRNSDHRSSSQSDHSKHKTSDHRHSSSDYTKPKSSSDQTLNDHRKNSHEEKSSSSLKSLDQQQHRSSEHKTGASSSSSSGERKSSTDHRRSDHRSGKEREKHRHRERGEGEERRREKTSRASIGIQCRRDKTLPRTVTHQTSIPQNSSNDLPTSGPRFFGYSMANPLRNLAEDRVYTYGRLMYVEVYPNGGGKVLHSWQDDLDLLSEQENAIFAKEFTTEAFREGNDGYAIYCTAIVHNAARGLPDFLEYLGDEHSNLPVKHGVLGHPRELETTTMACYKERVRENYKNGCFRFGHLDNLSLVGTASEEAGGYFPDILDMLDEIPIVSQTLPWGEKSVLHEEILRNKSNDGPILWIRPGEQSIPTAELGKSPLKRYKQTKYFHCLLLLINPDGEAMQQLTSSRT